MKKVDLSVSVDKNRWTEVFKNQKMGALGHLGTHFDVMNKVFSLDNTCRTGRLVDASLVRQRDIDVQDIHAAEIQENDFVMFYTGFLKEAGYGTTEYFANHPQLSMALIHTLIEKQVSMIGLDAAGVRRGAEHTPTDQFCADQGVFIIENLANLDILLRETGSRPFTVYTFPINFEDMTGLPCRVIAEVE